MLDHVRGDLNVKEHSVKTSTVECLTVTYPHLAHCNWLWSSMSVKDVALRNLYLHTNEVVHLCGTFDQSTFQDRQTSRSLTQLLEAAIERPFPRTLTDDVHRQYSTLH